MTHSTETDSPSSADRRALQAWNEEARVRAAELRVQLETRRRERREGGDRREQPAASASATELTELRTRAETAEHRADNLERALTSNRRIGMAIGILLERPHVPEEQAFELLSGGQQARFQILLLELSGATLLLLDEPTDNLDLASAEALEAALAAFEGTVVAVTHDRWFARSFDRFVVFGADGRVYEAPEPVWDEARVARER